MNSNANNHTSLLQARDIHARYADGFQLEGINFDLDTGKILALVGPNGSGKTTLLKTIAGLMRPFKGQILLHGQSLEQISDKQRARRIAHVPQNAPRPHGLTIRQMTLLGRYPWLGWFGLYAQTDYQAAQHAMSLTSTSEFISRTAETLSGGEWQRALLAKALAQVDGTKFPLLLLDEPASAMDYPRALELYTLAASLACHGCGIIMSIHDCNMAAIFATDILALKNGRQLFYGSVNSVFTQQNLETLYDYPFALFTHPDLGLPQAYPRFKRPPQLYKACKSHLFNGDFADCRLHSGNIPQSGGTADNNR